ncbi:hypothetical protein B0A50_00246 [Salinomyces thailandicus]|uniref:Uncharacterized protein n=1 Tax=Salinomyces thailandicus TaxID=706561 RepID=A0A4U0UHP8_9PEZI|nr:hypothetical protein B0A50_00246 [Salinomyces thailandica]
MGPAGQAAIPLDAATLSTALLPAFPSPATSPGDLLDSPSLRSVYGSPRPARTPLREPAEPIATLPGEVHIRPAMTPPATGVCDCQADMNVVVGGALAPGNASPVEPSQPKAGPGLRLPSFETLGIAAPHPDRFGQEGLDGALDLSPHLNMKDVPGSVEEPEGRGPENAELNDAFARLGGGKLAAPEAPMPNNGGRATTTPVQHYVATLTPPAEGGEMNWHSMATVSLAPMDSPANESGAAAPTALSTRSASGASTRDNSSCSMEDSDFTGEAQSWIEGAVRALIENLQSSPVPGNPLRVLSHALPSPSSSGHVFPTIIGAIHNSTPASPTVWVNVFHAIPGRFNLADLPTSPPTTPGPPVGGEDYFTQKVFDSAVPISDYQEDLSSLPRSPRPVVPPSSINVAVVERYIPPTNANEFAEMFNTNGPSILVDRMVELSPHNGTLAFTYPTRTGAHTFLREYLGPILDPILRSMCVVHGLSFDLSRSLGNMLAADRLLEHDQLHRQIAKLCATLNQRSSSMNRFHGRRAHFSLTYSGKKEVVLGREAWAKDWWTKQEKQRIRDVVTRFAQEAQRRNSNGHGDRAVAPAELIQQVLDGVVKRAYQHNQEPERGVEVGVFIIKRSE